MLLPETIAQIVLESLRLTNNIMESIPVEQRQQFWTDYQVRQKAMEDIVNALIKQLNDNTSN